MKNYYEILEVNPKASNEIIENAYKILNKKYQPDQYVGERRIEAENKLRDIDEAYKILTDSFLREQYNAELEREQASKKQLYRKVEEETPRRTRKVSQNIEADEVQNSQQDPKIGSFGAIINILKTLFKKREGEKFNIKNLQREDFIAAGLTAVIIVVLGVVLWFIPLTRGFITSLIPF